MSRKKIRLGIIFGGESSEHDVSLLSAQSLIKELDPATYDIYPIGISQTGEWFFFEPKEALHIFRTIDRPCLETHFTDLPLSQVPISDETMDVVFPVLHGPLGEDGSVQGMLKLAKVPFVGSSVLGSAICMDKDVSKRLLRDAGLPIPKFWTIQQGTSVDFETFQYPVFVKPANLGSSVGVEKARNKEELKKAIENAFLYDHKVLIEEFIDGIEIECGVLGNQNPRASQLARITSSHEFYSYEAKYIDPEGATFEIPASLPLELTEEIQRLAIRAFQILCCEGMARVDFFVRGNEIFINEVNTIPGFTEISMYPKMWAATGISYASLIRKLIDFAIEKGNKERQLLRSPPMVSKEMHEMDCAPGRF
ncbi:MAG: D-alanine--D-alanine ligase [Simkaniaceae bacterium]|nr:D-alanine--D-alanine ligase [Simkaniaceae bacterium]